MAHELLRRGIIAVLVMAGSVWPFLGGQKQRTGSASKKEKPMQFAEVIDHAHHSICAIVRADNPLGFGVPIGTGFFINDSGFFVTNAHVARDFFTLRGQGVPVGLSVPNFVPGSSKIGGMGVADVTPIEINDEADIALLRADNLRGAKKPDFFRLTFDREVLPGTDVAMTGFPLHHPYPITMTASVASQTESGTFVDDLNGKQYPGPYYFIDKAIFRGFSGAPVYLKATGDLIGIAVRTQNAPIETPSGPSGTLTAPAMGQVLTLDRLRGMLTNHNVPYTAVQQ